VTRGGPDRAWGERFDLVDDQYGWREVATASGAVNAPLPAIAIPPDGRTYPLPATVAADPLAGRLGQRVVFADVVAL
jgi:hypothetical protein